MLALGKQAAKQADPVQTCKDSRVVQALLLLEVLVVEAMDSRVTLRQVELLAVAVAEARRLEFGTIQLLTRLVSAAAAAAELEFLPLPSCPVVWV